jgi:hypothetical protein
MYTIERIYHTIHQMASDRDLHPSTLHKRMEAIGVTIYKIRGKRAIHNKDVEYIDECCEMMDKYRISHSFLSKFNRKEITEMMKKL